MGRLYMRDSDLGELYGYLGLFSTVYGDYAEEATRLQEKIQEIYSQRHGPGAGKTLDGLRNPRNAGRRKKTLCTERIMELRDQGHSIREIAEQTNTPRSTVQRLLSGR